MPVKVQITVPGMSIREKTYPDIYAAAEALGKTPDTLRRWLRNHHGCEPGKQNDIMKRRIFIEGNPKARKVAAPKPRKERRKSVEVKPDYFKPVFYFWCVVACCLAVIAL